MVFTSFKFILFFGLVFVIYYGLMKKYQWQWLLIVSYIFYMSASPAYAIFLITTTIVTFFAGKFISNNSIALDTYIKDNKDSITKEEKKTLKSKVHKENKAILTITVFMTIGMLVVLKYSFFIFENVKFVVGLFGENIQMPELELIIPIGLSFYTFQTIGYCVDVYRGTCSAQNNIFKYALFVSYFPQILQGPIGTYGDIEKELYSKKEFDYERVCKGVIRAVWGFFKKMVIADNIAIIINPVFDNSQMYYGITIIFALVMYAIQLYADFSGFMDIALGVSEMLGIKLIENFNTPYFSKNVPEFWRRWHISLGNWFRNYLFYSVLRCKKCEKIRKKYKKIDKADKGNNIATAFALATVWLATGIWHGASWNYVVWGIYYGIIITYGTIKSKKIKGNSKKEKKAVFIRDLIKILRTFIIVVVGYSIFRPENLEVTFILWKNMFLDIGVESLKWLLTGKKMLFIITMVATGVLFVRDCLSTVINVEEFIRKRNFIIRWGIYIVLLLSILIFKAGETQSFSYFKF